MSRRAGRLPAGPEPPVSPGLYTAELLEAFAAGEHAAYLAAGALSPRPRLAAALALADLRPGLHLVDVGAGRGEAALHAARAGVRVTAVDFSAGSLALARQTLAVGLGVVGSAVDGPAAPVPRLVRADATRLPLADGCADRVLALDVVEHLHPWQLAAALAEVRRILRPGGHVVIHTLPNRWALAVAYPALRLLGGTGMPKDPRSSYERLVHVNEQDPRRLAGALRAAGLDARVWVEEWTTRHAARAGDGAFPDAARSSGYPVLRRPLVRAMARMLMATPLANVVGNDIFAVAWLPAGPAPAAARRSTLTTPRAWGRIERRTGLTGGPPRCDPAFGAPEAPGPYPFRHATVR